MKYCSSTWNLGPADGQSLAGETLLPGFVPFSTWAALSRSKALRSFDEAASIASTWRGLGLPVGMLVSTTYTSVWVLRYTFRRHAPGPQAVGWSPLSRRPSQPQTPWQTIGASSGDLWGLSGVCPEVGFRGALINLLAASHDRGMPWQQKKRPPAMGAICDCCGSSERFSTKTNLTNEAFNQGC